MSAGIFFSHSYESSRLRKGGPGSQKARDLCHERCPKAQHLDAIDGSTPPIGLEINTEYSESADMGNP